MLLAPEVVEDPDKSAAPVKHRMRRSRCARDVVAYQDQGKQKDQGKEQVGGGGDIHTSSPVPVTGGVWGGDAGLGYLLEFGGDALYNAALTNGPLIFGSTFRGYEGFLDESDESSLAILLEWSAYFYHEDGENLDKIRDNAAYVRSCVARQYRPGLTRPARAWLRQRLVEALDV
jgi:hypothetical protein